MYRPSRIIAAGVICLGCISLSGCQIPSPLADIGRADVEKSAPLVVTEADQVRTVTVFETRNSQTVDTLSAFASDSPGQESRIEQFRRRFKKQPDETNALLLGAALTMTAENNLDLDEAVGLLKSVSVAHQDFGLAVMMLRLTDRQRELFNAARATRVGSNSSATGTRKALPETNAERARLLAEIRQRETEIAEREQMIASTEGENLRLRQALARAEQKLKELAQIENDLADVKRVTQP